VGGRGLPGLAGIDPEDLDEAPEGGPSGALDGMPGPNKDRACRGDPLGPTGREDLLDLHLYEVEVVSMGKVVLNLPRGADPDRRDWQFLRKK